MTVDDLSSAAWVALSSDNCTSTAGTTAAQAIGPNSAVLDTRLLSPGPYRYLFVLIAWIENKKERTGGG